MSLMNILPTELLLEIFQYLDGSDIYRCKAVCKRWYYAIEGLLDNEWKEFCLKDFHYVMDVHKHSRLNWCDLYKSLYMWPKIKSTKLTAHRFSAQSVQHFQLLNNGIVAACVNQSGDVTYMLWGYSDTIVYYNAFTFAETDRLNVGFLFSSYKENDNLICVVTRSGRLCVIIKKTKKKFFVGILPVYENCRPGKFVLVENAVYFLSANEFLHSAKLMVKNNELDIESKILDYFSDQNLIIAINCIAKDHLFILTDDIDKGIIYEYVNESFVTATIIHSQNTIYDLGDYGFDWTDPDILHWIFQTFKKDALNITKLKISSACSIGKTIILGTYRRMINIYAYPYTPMGELKLYNAKPRLSINMNNIYKFVSPFRDIQLLDVIELKNAHKLIVLTDYQLFSIELVHPEGKKKTTKRCKSGGRSGGNVKVGKISAVTSEVSRGYETRSATLRKRLMRRHRYDTRSQTN